MNAWRDFWFRPDAPLNLAITRVLVSLSALWVVLSRRDLPAILAFPRAMWETVLPERRWRFLLIAPLPVERALWILLHVTLIAVLLGVLTRATALTSALLIYHFAPLETIFRNGNPYLLGFTTPCVMLVLIAVSASAGEFRGEVSWRNRWPVAACQFLLAAMYFFAGYAKLVTTGIDWLRPQNIRNYILAINQALGMAQRPSLALWIADHRLLCGFISTAGVAIELLFPIVLVTRRYRVAVVAAMIIFHLLNFLVFRIAFQSVLLLLVFIDWRAVFHNRRMAA